MSYKAGLTAVFLLVALTALPAESHGGYEGVYQLPALPPAGDYGNVLLGRIAPRRGFKPVIFSHWLHRQKFTCRVCHTELEFNLKANTTPITETDNRSGRYCGACHNGRIAFRPNGNCDRCHTGTASSSDESFSEFMSQPFPTTPYGNRINWVEALRKGLISPRNHLGKKPQEIFFDKTLILESEWSSISSSIFPHAAHVEWLDCSTCHPDIFNIRKKTTKHFSMAAILQGKFCGVCHLGVAFPMDDCNGCHPSFEK